MESRDYTVDWQAELWRRLAVEPTINAMQRHLLFTLRATSLQTSAVAGEFQTVVEWEDATWHGAGASAVEAMGRVLLTMTGPSTAATPDNQLPVAEGTSALHPGVPAHIATQIRGRLALQAAQARVTDINHAAPVSRDDVAEELASKATSNRARVAFLSTKGATMHGWVAHCKAATDPDPVRTTRER